MASVNSIRTFNNNIILRLIIERRYKILRHLILIIVLGAAFYNSKMGFPNPASIYIRLSIFVVVLSVLYINMYWFVPKLLFKDNSLGYFLWNIVLFALAHVVGYYTRLFIIDYFNQAVPQKEQPNWIGLYLIFAMLMGTSAAVKLFQRWVTDSQRIN